MIGWPPVPLRRDDARRWRGRLVVLCPITCMVAMAVGPLAGSAGAATAATGALVGTFATAPGSCGAGTATGSYFRMILPSGGPAGPFLGNNNSSCSDKTYTLLTPGRAGGLVTGSYQPQPSPAFDSGGNALAGQITEPTEFYGVEFSTSTNPVDPQTGEPVGVPAVTVSGSTLSGDLRSFAASWNNQQFNQGAPKPDGSLPGDSSLSGGTFDAATGAFTLQWTSQIVGGPFNNFTGLWHLVGQFRPATPSTPVTTTPPTAAPGTGTAKATTTSPRAVSPSSGTSSVVPASGAGVQPSAGSADTGGGEPAASSAAATGPGGKESFALTTIKSTRHWNAPRWLMYTLAFIALVGLVSLLLVERRFRQARIQA